MRVLYGVSPIGFGHASRAVAVGELLAAAGAQVKYASGGPTAEFLEWHGFQVEDVVTEPIPKVEGGEMKNALAWYLRYWRGFGKTKKKMKATLEEWDPDTVVGDEEFASVALALEKGVSNAMIADELQLGFARTWLAKRVETRVAGWYQDLQERVSQLIIPDSGTDVGNKRHVGPIVRKRTKEKEEVIRELSLPRDGRLVLLAFSGSGVGDYIVERLARAASPLDANIVVMGNRGPKLEGERIFDVGVVRDGQNLVGAADLVVSLAGKSTIDEAASFGTPIVAIPVRNHSEQERNAAALGYSANDIEKLPELVAEKIGRREAARNFDGAAAASRLILSAL